MSIRITTLPNGLRVVTEPMDQFRTTSIGVWVGVGARAESAEQNGVSHMLEHMAFKGTATRSALDIAEAIEDVGGHLNAYTSREQTAYYARVLEEDVPLAVELLGDILQRSAFEPDELERERGVVIQEIGEVQDTPDDLVFDLLQEAAYPDQAVGRSILGTVETVSGFSRDSLSGYMDRHYGAGAMVVAAAGKVDHDRLVALVADQFGGLEAGVPAELAEAEYRGGDLRRDRKFEQVHLTFGFPGVSFADDRFFATQVMSTILGEGMSSRLFQEVREKRGLAYSVYSFNAALADGGLFGIYAGTSPAQADELATVIAGELGRMTLDVTERELVRARAQLKASTLMALESSWSRAEQMARQLMMFGRIVPLEEIVARIEGVTLEAVAEAARSVMAGSPTVAAVGPLRKLPGYERLAERFAA
ncbi:MAG: insulinase family protein [Alphaproteobacteria bacterium]|nr:insulinase family protein [Alphaproteobacteria bacterium]